MPLRRQPRPCPRLRTSIYRRWYPRVLSLSSVSLFFSSLLFLHRRHRHRPRRCVVDVASTLALFPPRRFSSSFLIFSHLLSSRESPCYRLWRPSSCVRQGVPIMRACQFHSHASGKRLPRIVSWEQERALWSLIDYIIRRSDIFVS